MASGNFAIVDTVLKRNAIHIMRVPKLQLSPSKRDTSMSFVCKSSRRYSSAEVRFIIRVQNFASSFPSRAAVWFASDDLVHIIRIRMWLPIDTVLGSGMSVGTHGTFGAIVLRLAYAISEVWVRHCSTYRT